MKKVIRQNPNYSVYSEYIFNHVSNVLRSWEELLRPALEQHMDQFGLKDYDLDAISEVLQNHDQSKWQSPEWDAYLNHFYPTDDYPDDKEKFDKAWLHHQHANGHHWQHWILIRDEGNIYPLDMPFAEICNMVCDWHSFSAKDDDNSAWNWYQDNGDKMILSENTRSTVEQLVEFLKQPLPQEGAEDV